MVILLSMGTSLDHSHTNQEAPGGSDATFGAALCRGELAECARQFATFDDQY